MLHGRARVHWGACPEHHKPGTEFSKKIAPTSIQSSGHPHRSSTQVIQEVSGRSISPHSCASWDASREYLGSLLRYLESFYQRTQPLGNLQRIEDKVAADFDARFEAGSVAGWEDRGAGATSASKAAQQLDLDAFDSVEEVSTLGRAPGQGHTT